MVKWYDSMGKIGKVKPCVFEHILRKKAISLARFCLRHNIPYTDIYFIDSEGTAVINYRAKSLNGTVKADGYAFVKSKTKKESE